MRCVIRKQRGSCGSVPISSFYAPAGYQSINSNETRRLECTKSPSDDNITSDAGPIISEEDDMQGCSLIFELF